MYLDKAKERFRELLQSGKGHENVRPCSSKEVRDLEEHLGLLLPKAYEEFLLWTGKGGGLLGGLEFDWIRVRDCNRSNAVEIMQELNCSEPLPEDAIVFLVSSSVCTFLFIRASEGDNPPVHLFKETQSGFEMVWNYYLNLEDLYLRRIETFTGYRKS